ncbi:DUF456 domain-containing protein [uncultured Rikenella sp.]|uniref:DUF456 domain-containing protein n=1 Tax=uncultured Rikenella sp. TaxID=368003 RepID=UPI002636EB77|nr:DUF456 domain-containing protein [uncultured Rikenella sp.]
MEIFLIILAFIVLLLAMIGSVVPALPGVPLAYLSLWIGRWSGYTPFDNTFMGIMAGVTLVVFLADYFLPPLILKKAGGSKAATWGSIIGMVIGMIFTPIGMLLGMLLGAFLGEILYAGKSGSTALTAALGAFIGFLVGTGLKLLLCFYILYKLIAMLIA